MGGFNYGKICWNTWSTSSNESSIDFKFIECIRDCYLFQHVNKPTRGRFNKGNNKITELRTILQRENQNS